MRRVRAYCVAWVWEVGGGVGARGRCQFHRVCEGV